MSKPVLAFAVVLTALAVYANSIGNGFVWDDPIILARQIPIFRSAGTIFFPPQNIPQFAPDYYRPLVIVSYVVDRAVGAGAAWPFHLTVVLAHALTTLAVFAFGARLFSRVPGAPPERALAAAAAGAALFAVHPVHSEAVAWVAGRADVFAGLFGVVALYAHLRSGEEPRFAVLAGVALLLALLAKEVAISVVGLLLALDWLVPPAAEPRTETPSARAQRRRAAAPRARGAALRSSVTRYAPLAVAVGVYALLRLGAVGGGLGTRSGEVEGSLLAKLLAAIAVYAGKLLAPLSLNAFIADLPESAIGLLAGAVVVLAYAAFFATAVRRQWQVVAFLLLWPAVTLAPSLTILFKIPEVPVAERYLYLPSVGFCLLAGWAAALAFASRHIALRAGAAVGFTLALLAGAAQTVVRNGAWASDLALWSDTAAKSPSAGMPLRSLGAALFRNGDLDLAQRAYEQALERRNDSAGRATIYGNLGTIALTRGDLDRAEDFYRRVVEMQATPDSVYNLGVIALRRAQGAGESGDATTRRGQAATALQQLTRAEGASPHDPDIQVAIGQALDLLDRGEEARGRYRRALDLGLAGPRAAQVRQLLGPPS